ncbi:hypothetical protein [Streptomyces sp. NPDC056549]|uniref:hypothetical protein n=1 Tax=Streptomyces sp. NPDC056549 TaxID=3345864 RepID=UPI0036CD0BEC
MSPGNEQDSFGNVDGSGQTRTHLPGDNWGGARRPVRSSRSLITVLGVVVLLVAAIVFANRGETEPTETSGRRPSTAGRTSPTSATGVRPVTGKNGAIPTGYTHDEQGAQSAAANYAVALGSAEMFTTATRTEIVATVYAPGAPGSRQNELARAYGNKDILTSIGLQQDGSAPQGMTFISRVIPAGSKVESYNGDLATVAVWHSTLFGIAGEGSRNPVSEAWYTETFELRWTDGDWKVTKSTQKDGPVPVGRDQMASSAKDMADAVGQFGNFTYAR